MDNMDNMDGTQEIPEGVVVAVPDPNTSYDPSTVGFMFQSLLTEIQELKTLLGALTK